MRGIEDSRQRWNTLFHHHDTPSDLRKALKSEQDDNICHDGLRSICWKAFLLFEDLSRTQWPDRISEARSAYVALKEHFLKFIKHPDDLQSTVDPLADDEQSPWQTLRQDEQMRADISQDVDRCLQENFFFREPATKAKMIDILFIYSKLNPDLGYRQGMHELLAPILWVIDRDAIDPKFVEEARLAGQDDDTMFQLLDCEFVEHDSFGLFCSVMQSTRVYYEHNKHRSTNGQTDAIPIVLQCEHIHNDLLVTTDVELADHLQAIEVLPQIFLTRWMRLLFGREFPFQDMLMIWDLLFAEGLRLELIDFVCVAMLLRVRWQLLNSDSSAALTTLLRYPSPDPHTPLSFVHDGLYLEQNPTPERGAFIISKYSGKPPELSKIYDLTCGKARPGRKFQFRNNLSEASSPSRSPARFSPLGIEGLFQDVSEGIQRRTETWGVAKAVRGAVNEAKKNMQAIQSEQGSRFPRYGDVAMIRAPDPSLHQGSEAITQLQAKIEHLEERNKVLAKKLGLAVNDIRSQVLKNDVLDADTTNTVKHALSEVESVQTSLETFRSTPDARRSSKGDGNPKEANHFDNLTPAKGKAIMSENHKFPRSSTDSSTNTSTAKSPVGSNSGQHSVLSSKPANNIRPLRHAPRASLASSEFSWMLGDDRHLSSFVSPASVPPEQTRQGALFSNGDSEQKKPDDEPDGMAMKSLRGAESRE
ncbi:rab-GTPase-TBC domain-containing protein [Aspergillus cavernicola]|uniref:Rab-GTPase-TBC domain-containing protein n=1 Tax=Aspergillus cavernicola TaxID=176166 RepID=A0ABR4HV38_9EURO